MRVPLKMALRLEREIAGEETKSKLAPCRDAGSSDPPFMPSDVVWRREATLRSASLPVVFKRRTGTQGRDSSWGNSRLLIVSD